MSRRPVALSIAGTDSGGGAGIVADVRTFASLGAWPAVAVTAVTAQNTLGVGAVELIPPAHVRRQIEAVARDLGVDAAKTGMLAGAPTVEEVARAVVDLGPWPLVVDPVLVSSHGEALLDGEGLTAVRELLLPLAEIVTPNLAEAAALLGGPAGSPAPASTRAEMRDAATALAALGPRAVLVTGGHLEDPGSPDCLVLDGRVEWLEGGGRRAEGGTHGTGCVLSAALAAGLANGAGTLEAAQAAKRFVVRAISAGAALAGFGSGVGPVDPGVGRDGE
ncbi:MAG: bifunctional hydroxymethylpyrimidine kinase/phosphomethylpyrimidine kinase [Acidimicrobiales bacterium]